MLPLLASAASSVAQSATNFSCGSPSSPASLSVFANGSYAVAIAGAAVFSRGKVSLHAAGRYFDSEDGSLVLLGPGEESAGSDARLGAYSAFALSFATTSAPPLRITASFACFTASGAIVFAAAFPDGAPQTNTSAAPSPSLLGKGEFGSSSAPVAHFPSFAASPGDALGSELAFVEINGRFGADNTAVGHGLRGFTGGQVGGPLIVFDDAFMPPARPAAALVAPLTSLKEAILGLVPDPRAGGSNLTRLVAGPQGRLTSLPAGYNYSVAIVSAADGVNSVVARFGALMRARYASWRLGGDPADAASADADPGLWKLSYWTDNGGYYDEGFWSRFGPPANASNTAVDVLLRLQAYHRAAGIPVATYQLDPWFYPQDGTGCCSDWAPDPTLFPEPLGFRPLVDAGMQFTLIAAFSRRTARRPHEQLLVGEQCLCERRLVRRRDREDAAERDRGLLRRAHAPRQEA